MVLPLHEEALVDLHGNARAANEFVGIHKSSDGAEIPIIPGDGYGGQAGRARHMFDVLPALEEINNHHHILVGSDPRIVEHAAVESRKAAVALQIIAVRSPACAPSAPVEEREREREGGREGGRERG